MDSELPWVRDCTQFSLVKIVAYSFPIHHLKFLASSLRIDFILEGIVPFGNSFFFFFPSSPKFGQFWRKFAWDHEEPVWDEALSLTYGLIWSDVTLLACLIRNIFF